MVEHGKATSRAWKSTQLAFTNACGSVTCARNWRLVLNTRQVKVAISDNSFAFSVLCRQFLESVHKCLRICDLCKELAFGAQHSASQSRDFRQLVCVQRVMPPVPGERSQMPADL